MNKSELVEAIAQRCGTTQKQADQILSAAIEVIQGQVAAGDKVVLVNFGVFEKRARKARQGRNPKTGEPMDIPAASIPAFTPGKLFKEKCHGSTANPAN